MKSFGLTGPAQPARREPFKFTVLRDEEPETHEFRARVTADVTGLAGLFAAMSGGNEAMAIPQIMRMISRALDNKDGVPSSWRPVALPEKDTDEAGTVLDEVEPQFRGPDGKLYPWSESDSFTAFEAGSSRRRWLALAEDDEVEARAEDLIALFAWVCTLAGKDPTPRSG